MGQWMWERPALNMAGITELRAKTSGHVHLIAPWFKHGCAPNLPKSRSGNPGIQIVALLQDHDLLNDALQRLPLRGRGITSQTFQGWKLSRLIKSRTHVIAPLRAYNIISPWPI